jgi:hypothetical protein
MSDQPKVFILFKKISGIEVRRFYFVSEGEDARSAARLPVCLWSRNILLSLRLPPHTIKKNSYPFSFTGCFILFFFPILCEFRVGPSLGASHYPQEQLAKFDPKKKKVGIFSNPRI